MAQSVLLEGGYIASICNNAANTVKTIASYVILILGLVLIIVSIVQIVKGFLANGRTAWIVTIGSLLFGGFLTFGGWFIITGVMGGVGKNSFDKVMDGMTPTTHHSITGVTNGTDTAKNAVAIMSDNFFIPFAEAVAVCVGVVMVVMAVYQIAKYFMASGKSQISLVKVGVLALLGSILFAATPTDNSAGWKWIVDTAVGITYDTVVGAAEGKSIQQTPGFDAPIVGKQDTQEVTDDV